MSIIDFNKPILCGIESFNPMPIKDMMDIVDEKKKIVNTRLADCDNISRNRSFYGLEDVLWSLKNSKYIQECISQGIWFGELEHPPRNGDIKRLMMIDDDRVSHCIKKYYADKNFLKGIVQFIPPKGDIVWRWITEADVNIAFSLRFYTPNYVVKKDSNGVEYVKKLTPMYPVTFDVVKNPGYERVRLVDPTEYSSKNDYYRTNGTSETSFEGVSLEWFSENTEKQLKEIVETVGKEDISIISDLYDNDFTKNKAKFNKKNLTMTYSTEDNQTFTMNLNPYIFGKIMKDIKG